MQILVLVVDLRRRSLELDMILSRIPRAQSCGHRNEVEQCLLNTAEDLGPVGRDNDYGAGLMQTQNDYDCLVNTIDCCVAPM
jgi:hypothetical protein